MRLDVVLIDQPSLISTCSMPLNKAMSPRLERQMEIGDRGAFRAARVGDNDL
jgi:hypothetical protein